MQGATPCLLARYSHISNSWIFVQNTASRSHDFICFQPRKDCSTLVALGLDSSIVPLSFSNSTRQAKDKAASSMDNKKGPFKVLVTGVSNI